MSKRWPYSVLLCVVIPAAASLILGTMCHEIVGHGLTAVLFGGRIERVHILGVRFDPGISWEGWMGYYGYCYITPTGSARTEHWVSLAGSLSTWAVSVIAIVLLWMRRWAPRKRLVLAWLGLWWIDLLTYT